MGEDRKKTILFISIVCLVCAFLLSSVAVILQPKQKKAALAYQVKQLLIASKILSSDGYLLVKKNDQYVRASLDLPTHLLVEDPKASLPNDTIIFTLYNKRIKSLLTNEDGEVFTFKELNIDEEDYVESNKRQGYAHLPYKLVYQVLDNTSQRGVESYVIPVNGFGLWDAIYGYIGIKPDGNTVIGITWYEQKETPGLGAEINLPAWQKQFKGKQIFHQSLDGQIHFQTAQIGIIVVKGTVKDIYGTGPKSFSAVDGISGATETGNGISNAYRDSLTPYRQFLINLHEGKIQ
jgi:Na+-transporting NADH:ubiquinone oxidoreductase subunit C